MTIITELPKATHTGTLTIGNIEIPCCVLKDGRRLITQRGMYAAQGKSSKGTNLSAFESATQNAYKFPQSIAPYVFESATQNQIEGVEFIGPKGRSLGYQAELLIIICDAYMQARDNGELYPQQIPVAIQASKIIRALAKVGITALIDEVTGYIDDKVKDEYQKLLDRLLLGEPLPAERIIAKEFFEEVVRVWNVNPQNRCLGKVVNNVLYRRLCPGMLDALKERNRDRYSNGNLKCRHTQYISDPDGRTAIVRHVEFTTLLLRGCDNREDAYGLLDRLLPVQG